MEENDQRDLESLFAQVQDPRLERTKLHRLRDIIILVICGVLCGAEGWVEIEEFGKAKEAFFTELLGMNAWNLQSLKAGRERDTIGSLPASNLYVFWLME